ncbi:MAG TPA: PQQ-binding-like beta-propeller repeat protein [Steroidobacteraceae bacterium]|nr:PQQ-binding-like beta-propeller repeat protein [Steroidobacteraceae bacterium]
MTVRRQFLRISLGCGLLAAVLVQVPGRAQRPPRAPAGPFATFTAEQAALGKTLYAQQCGNCHGRNLSGSEFATPLNGNAFSLNWGGKSAGELFTFIHNRMPPAAPGSLQPAATANLMAYLLQVNGAKAGEGSLAADAAALAALRIPRNPISPAPPMMPLSPLSPPLPKVFVPNPLDQISPVSDAMLRNPPPGDWLLWRRTYNDQGFSPLKQITRQNVEELHVSWAWTLPAGHNEATPLEHDGVLFVASFGDTVQALDAASGDLLWQYSRNLPTDARLQVHRNIAIYGEKLFVPTSDDHVVALDVKTGTVVWDVAVADYRLGWQVTGGPIVARGKVLQGIVGQSPGGGSIVALDALSGKEAWRFHTIARPGEFGGESWNGLPVEKRSGASVWTAGSYDPQLNLAYFGVGQTYDTGPLLHPINKPGVTTDSLYTDSTLALNPETGKLVWHFQHVHNDQWDLDWAFEQQVMNLPVGGAPRKVVVTSGKMGIIEAMDAASGRYLYSQDLGIQNVVSAIDPATGEKSINPAVVVGDGKPHTICPHPGGGREWIATSYNPGTRVLYVPMVESCMDLIPAAPGERGNLSSGYNWTIRPRPDSDGKYGRTEAVNLESKQVLWTDRQRAPGTTCLLATAGGVVFSGSFDRYLRAYDDTTGKHLWQVRMNDVPSSCPISYSVKGRQYVAVVVGNGGIESQTFSSIVPEIQSPQEHASSVWVFELPKRFDQTP